MLETRHLVLLVTLDEVGTLSAAARRVFLTPSALSQQLRQLERRLGGRLFRRQGQRLVMTSAARRIVETARPILAELARTEAEVRALMSGTRGTIRLATSCLQSYRWLPAVLKELRERWPDIQVTLVPEAASAPLEWLRERKLDVALVSEPFRPGAGLKVAPLFRDELVAVVGEKHPWFGHTEVDLCELESQDVWSDDRAFDPDAPLGKALADAGGIEPRRLTVIPTASGATLEMARAGLGVALLPRWAVEPFLREGDLGVVRLGAAGVWLEWLVATRDEDEDHALAAFLEVLAKRHPRASHAGAA